MLYAIYGHLNEKNLFLVSNYLKENKFWGQNGCYATAQWSVKVYYIYKSKEEPIRS